MATTVRQVARRERANKLTLVATYLPEDMMLWLDMIAEQDRRSRSDMIRQILDARRDADRQKDGAA